jgi:hypothetical protein
VDLVVVDTFAFFSDGSTLMEGFISNLLQGVYNDGGLL